MLCVCTYREKLYIDLHTMILCYLCLVLGIYSESWGYHLQISWDKVPHACLWQILIHY